MRTTPLQKLGTIEGNQLYIKREDLIPFCFGGNKARKAELFFQIIDAGSYDCVVTYGSSSSNHCRVIANMCASRGISCHVIAPAEAFGVSYNQQMMKLYNAEISVVHVSEVHDQIENTIAALKRQGKTPYFIPGGGHGITGTQAYVNCYDEIADYRKTNGTTFDLIFLASGTGTTQAGLICGKLLHHDSCDIIGISIARKNPRGRDIVLESVREYMGHRATLSEIQDSTVFVDEYVTNGYGQTDSAIQETILKVLLTYGIPLDETYTGKAFHGMTEYLKNNQIRGKNVLFIHTGGTPLFFDALRKWDDGK